MACLHCESTTETPDFLFETKFWRAYLAPEQSYLGRSIIELNNHKRSLSQISQEEWNDLGDMVKYLEGAIKEAFKADMFNWACLMNDAYKAKTPNPHVHWHVRPRYKNPVEFAGKTYTDPDFGAHYDRDRREVADEVTQHSIVQEIRDQLND